MNKAFIHGFTDRYRGLLCAVTITLCSPMTLADRDGYAPPPAGPYKPLVVVNDDTNTTSDSSSKVYKFPSEDLIQGDAPRLQDQPESEKKPAFATVLKHPDNTATTRSSAQSAMRTVPDSLSSVPPGNGAAWRQNNPWSPLSQTTGQDAQPRYQIPGYGPGQGWYPGYNYSRQQYPYGYAYPGNTGNSPFNMPTPWSMMPMQPFFPGR